MRDIEDLVIYEVTTLSVLPGQLRSTLQCLEENIKALPNEFLGLWTTEIGNLNDIVVMRRLSKPGHSRTQSQTAKGTWIDLVSRSLIDVHIENYRLAPYLAHPSAGRYGNLYEMRTYTFRYAYRDELLDTWKKPLEIRQQLSKSPLVMYAITGNLQKFVHFWPYDSFEERSRVRSIASAQGIWPPPGGATRWLEQSSSLLRPTSVSPLN